MGFCQVSLKGSSLLIFLKLVCTNVLCHLKNKKDKIKQKRCFACITLDNKVIKTVVESVVPAIMCRYLCESIRLENK